MTPWVPIYRPLHDIPNREGFEFVGIRHDGSKAQCEVRRDPKTRCHYVTGEATYTELKGWTTK